MRAFDFANLFAGAAWGEVVRCAQRSGDWLPASAGTETPTTYRTGRRLLYCWQPSTGRHAYLDCGTDFILSDEDAALARGDR